MKELLTKRSPEHLPVNPQASEPISKRIEHYVRQGKTPPLHYRLYSELSLSGGKLPEVYIATNPHLTESRIKAIENAIPDICTNIASLEHEGYRIISDPKTQLTETHFQEVVARQMASTIRKTYLHPSKIEETLYPLKEANHEETQAQMRAGAQDIFMVYNPDGESVATFSLVTKGNVLAVPFLTEVGRTGVNSFALPQLRERGLGLRGVSQLRTLLLWLDQRYYNRNGNKPIAGFFSDLRCTAQTRELEYAEGLTVPNGDKVQGTFFGGIKHGVDLGYGIWGFGNQYALGNQQDGSGGMEPFLRIGQWHNPKSMEAGLDNRLLLAPNEKSAQIISALLGSFMEKQPEIVIDPSQAYSIEKGPSLNNEEIDPLVNLTTSGEEVFSVIDCIDTQEEIHNLVRGVLPGEKIMPMSEAILQCLDKNVPYIEFYVESTFKKKGFNNELPDVHRTSAVMKKLVQLGAIVTGFTPSDKGNGGLRLTFSLILPKGFKKGIIEPNFPERYYQNTRLEPAIEMVKDSVAELTIHSSRSPLNS